MRGGVGGPPGILSGPAPSQHPHGCGGSYMSYPRSRLRALGAVGCVAALAVLAACSSGGSAGSSGSNSNSGTVTVAVGANPLITQQMNPLTKSKVPKQ